MWGYICGAGILWCNLSVLLGCFRLRDETNLRAVLGIFLSDCWFVCLGGLGGGSYFFNILQHILVVADVGIDLCCQDIYLCSDTRCVKAFICVTRSICGVGTTVLWGSLCWCYLVCWCFDVNSFEWCWDSGLCNRCLCCCDNYLWGIALWEDACDLCDKLVVRYRVSSLIWWGNKFP